MSALRQPLRVLFLCTENAARSQIAEALLLNKGGAAFHVASAGTHPAQDVHPLAIDVLHEQGIDWTDHSPKGLDAVVGETWDLIITLCDRAREQCPTFPGQPIYADWGMPDPSRAVGNDATRRRAFANATQYLRQRIDFLRLIPVEKLERAALEQRVKAAQDIPASDEGKD